MANRDKLLEAAARIYSEAGFRGATTRRIAEEAGVNEVTLFRLFGSKSALIAEAVSAHAPPGNGAQLPLVSKDPERELTAFCSAHLTSLRESRDLIRKVIADLEEHPDMAPHICATQTPPAADLEAYVRRLKGLSRSLTGSDVSVACAMLLGALFSDGMGRDVMPAMFPQPARRAPALYARMFMRMLGLHEADDARPVAAPRRALRTRTRP